jgi:hypothetical protein
MNFIILDFQIFTMIAADQMGNMAIDNVFRDSREAMLQLNLQTISLHNN